MRMDRLVLWFSALMLLGNGRVRATDPNLEYKQKAACVLNAARFVTWPTPGKAEAAAPFVIGVIGENPFGSSLVQMVHGETVHGRRIVARRINAGDRCHLAFISRSETHRLPQLLHVIGQAGTLTVSDIDGFAGDGGMVELRSQNGRVRIHTNSDAATRAGLKIDRRLRQLAKEAQ